MKYIITNHAKQRRPHHPIKEDSVLIEWLKAFDNKFNFSNLAVNNTYKIHYKSNTAIIKRKNKCNLVLITFRGFSSSIDKFDFNNLIIRKVDNRGAIVAPIYRINYNGKSVKCGRVFNNTNSKEKYLLRLKKSLTSKYKIPDFKEDIYFNDFKEVEHFINKDENDGLYYLNQFNRIYINMLELQKTEPSGRKCF